MMQPWLRMDFGAKRPSVGGMITRETVHYYFCDLSYSFRRCY